MNNRGPVHTVTNEWEEHRDALLSKENKVGTTEISRYEYSVNAIGQRTSLAATGSAFSASKSAAWSYNARGEVVSANHSDTAQRRFYQYDPIGNREKSRTGTHTDSGGSLITYVSNSLNQYAEINPASGETSYDADGNQLTGPLPADPGQAATYGWDAENRLSACVADDINVGSYRYDPFGRRIMKTVGTGGPTGPTSTVFVYDGWNLAAEYQPNSGNWTLKTSYLFGQDLSGSLRGAGGVGGLLSVTQHGSLATDHFSPTYDGNGNVSEYLGTGGSIAAHFEYDPLGQVIVNTDSTNRFPIRFSTKYEDFETGLNYYGYRYYDSQQGRWLSRDPATERGGFNLYGFVGNNGVDNWDLWGLRGYPRNFVGPLQPGDYHIPEGPPGPKNIDGTDGPPADVYDNCLKAKNKWNPFWFRDMVRNKGPWDYKQKGKAYEDFGNFNYGATGAAFAGGGGFTLNELLQEAGRAQAAAGTSDPRFGKPASRLGMLFGKKGTNSNGDDPNDQEWIKRGFEWWQEQNPPKSLPDGTPVPGECPCEKKTD